MKYNGNEHRYDYFAPMLGNGEICTYIGYDGTNACTAESYEIKKNRRDCPTANIWWAGRRYCDTFERELIPFGNIEQTVNGKELRKERITDWSQELDIDTASLICICKYEDISVHTKAFIHAERNILCIRKTFYGGDTDFSFRYSFTESPDSVKTPRNTALRYKRNDVEGNVRIYYSVQGQQNYRGIIDFSVNKRLVLNIRDNMFEFSGRFSDGENVDFFLSFTDNNFDSDIEYNASSASKAVESGLENLFEEHKDIWKKYYENGFVITGDDEVDNAYKTALYHLKSCTTRWSVPIGINDTHWNGRYFAFDEYFCCLGLLGANQTELAKRVPEFRSKGLDIAIKRASSPGKTEARYPWETVETGEEASPPGFWYDHIFHMAHISMSAWDYFLHTNDIDWLREKGFRMIKSCAMFYMRHMVYRVEGGKTIIGKCSDLERLGCSVQNAYMTTCSVIKTLEITFRASVLLRKTDDFANECKKTAELLLNSLPVEDGAFVPFPGCRQKSIALFAGTFPYHVINRQDPRQRKAIEQFLSEEHIYGNMYAVGNGVSTWYACWKAMFFARQMSSGEAYASLKQATAGLGCFSECFEINEPDCIYRPWFSTSAGIILSSVNEMLLQFVDGCLYLLPAWPADKKNIAFRLSSQLGLVVEAVIKDNKLMKLSFEKKEFCDVRQVQIAFPVHIDISILDGIKKIALEEQKTLIK